MLKNVSISSEVSSKVVPTAVRTSSSIARSNEFSFAMPASISRISANLVSVSSRSSRVCSATISLARAKISRAARTMAEGAMLFLLYCFNTAAILSTLPKVTMAFGVVMPPVYNALAR